MRLLVPTAGTKQMLGRRWRNHGFTLFELVLVICLVAIFSGILLDRFFKYQELAEKAAMEQTVSAIRSALAIQMAGLVTHGKTDAIPALVDVNPFQFVTNRGKNYAGEYFEVSGGDIASGSWYFDLKRKELVYLIRRGEHFASAEGETKQIRYKVKLVHNEWLAKVFEKEGRDYVGGVVLEEIAPYRWDID
jgi:general secretion pathway protein G